MLDRVQPGQFPLSFAPICGGLHGRTGSTQSAAPSSDKAQIHFHFRVGAHSLPVEQGRIEMPQVPRHLRRCAFCATNAIGDERHCVFDCPHFQGLRQQHAMIFRDSHDAMRSVMWHKDQKSVCALVLALSMRPRHYDRFVLIGLCWLYGRSEFPPPPLKSHLQHFHVCQHMGRKPEEEEE